MARMVNRLTAVTVTKLNTPGLYFDGDGLLLKVVQGRDALIKFWVFRYRFDGKRRDMGLGPLRTFSLAEARERARQLRQQLAQNVDPLSARDADRAKRQRESATTFKLCAEQYIASHKASWKNAKHAAQWSATLATSSSEPTGALITSGFARFRRGGRRLSGMRFLLFDLPDCSRPTREAAVLFLCGRTACVEQAPRSGVSLS